MTISTLHRKIVLSATIVGTLFLASCEELGFLAEEVGLTEEEVIGGLRQALVHGTDTAVTNLNISDGYYGDELVKILLPEEALPVYDIIDRLPGNVIEDNILAINRAAEDAATEASPIFVDAIKELTITDGFDILNGDDTAATSYLRGKTYQKLFDAFKPKIETSLAKPLVLGISAESMYSELIGLYNTASVNGLLFDKINSNSLSDHTTNRALKGLFLKVGAEETLIREDPTHRVTAILEKVFAEQD